MREIVYTDEARAELAEAAAWHEEHGALGGGARFAAALIDEIERLPEMPFAAPASRLVPRLRVRTSTKLRYRLIYEVTDHEIRIVAIAHTSRDPAYWLDRVERSADDRDDR